MVLLFRHRRKRTRSRCEWSVWGLGEIGKPLLLAAADLKLFDLGQRRSEEVQVACKKLSRAWGLLEKHLADRPYRLGERFTVADLNIAAVMTLVPTSGLDIGDWPNVKAWLHDCLYRPAATDCRAVSFRIPRPTSGLGMLSMFV